jgi:hypothetical protein
MSSVAMRHSWSRCAECGCDFNGRSVWAGCLCDRCTDSVIGTELMNIGDKDSSGQAYPDCWECVLCHGPAPIGCCYCDPCSQVRQSPQDGAGCEFCPNMGGGCAACEIAAPAGWDHV